MEKRSLHYQDEKSDKFWTITLDSCSHAINFGRVGTAGQTQTKTFLSEEKAKQSYKKLIQEKLKKGYVDSNISPILPDCDREVERVVNTPPEAPSISTSAIPEQLDITRSLNLNPEDWLRATWRPRKPLLKPEPKPFDLEDALECLKKIQGKPQYQGHFWLDFSKANISISLTPQEAHFWLIAMICNKPNFDKMIAFIKTQNLSDRPEISDIISTLYLEGSTIPQQIVLPLFNLFSFIELLVAISDRCFLNDRVQEQINQHRWNIEYFVNYLLKTLAQRFKKFILPYLTDAEIEQMREILRPILVKNDDWHNLYYFASYIGMHDEVIKQIDSWQSDKIGYCVNANLQRYLRVNESKEIVFGLGSPQLVNTYTRHLNISLETPEYIRGWLAHTEYNALDWICHSIIKQSSNYQEDLLKTFTEVVKAPEAAPYMLELWLTLKKPKLARQWLEDNPIHAIVGLIPVAAGKHNPVEMKQSDVTRAAIDFLRSLKRKGYESLIRTAVERELPEIADIVRKEILDREEVKYIPFDDRSSPEWLQKLKTSPVSWVSSTDLPPIIVENNCLNDEQINACLLAIKQSTFSNHHPLIQHLKTHCQQQSLDNFVWSLFQRWLIEGAPSKEKWAMAALGILGSDAIALKLTPLIRQYPGENQHPRAVFGLECLRAIGTDTALMQIHGIAQKIKYQGLKQKAAECLQAIARDRNFTTEQLEDRIVPDFDLDARGSRIFDFGSRQFRLVLTPDLKPVVKDENGKIKDNLPKPGAKDNSELAAQAIADWKLLKKQISQTIKIQNIRLEQATITQRRWTWEEFETLLVRHPFITHLVQRLVWAGYDKNDRLINTFRVAEDQTYADINDEYYIPNAIATVGIVHPVHLTAEQRTTWVQTLSDYEIIPPFPQINREVYTLQTEELETVEITRFKNISIPGITLARTMESLGWIRGNLQDRGDYSVHYKYFAKSDTTAIIGDYENQHVEQNSIFGDDAIDGCLFLAGEHQYVDEYPVPGSWYDKQLKAKHLLLNQVDPLVISEVLRDLYIVTAKGNKV